MTKEQTRELHLEAIKQKGYTYQYVDNSIFEDKEVREAVEKYAKEQKDK